MNLLDKLKQVQKYYGWSDAKMAAELQVSRQTWNHIKHGRLTFQTKTLTIIASRFSNLQDDVISFILGTNTVANVDNTLAEKSA